MSKRRWAAVLVMIAVLVTAAVPAYASPSLSPTALGGKVKIVSFAFRPSSITVPVGSSVGWINSATIQHTTTSDTGLWDSGPLNPGAKFLHKFTTAGTFTYHCSIHPTMTGTIIVQ